MLLSGRMAKWRMPVAAGVFGTAVTLAVLHAVGASPRLLTVISVALAALAGTGFFGALLASRLTRDFHLHTLRLDTALNNMNQGLCMFDADNRLLIWNRRYVDMYSIDAKRIWPGCTIRDLLDARIAVGTFPLDPARYDADLRAALKQGKSFTIDLTLADGRTIAVVNQPMEDGGWVATHEDITERKRAEQELEQTRSFLNTVIENVPSPIIVKDMPSLRYRLLNRAAEKFLGIKRETILGKTARESLPPSMAETIKSQDDALADTNEAVYFAEHAIMTPGNGTRIATATRLPVMGAAGTPQYVINVVNDLTDSKRSEQRIAHMARHDPLTDLPNRAAFNECIGATIDLAALAGDKFALLSIDLDRFKAVNDVFSHAAGDALLHEIALRMQEACQGAFLARVGGDEFAVVTATGSQPAGAEALADRLCAALDADMTVSGHVLRVGITVGIAIYPQDGADAASLVGNADAALYRAKSEARGSIRFFEPAMDQQLRDKRALQQDLQQAIARDEITVHYQPQARIDGEITGFEALARWQHPVRGMVPPEVFIPLAEESGGITALGEWILRVAAREAAGWRKPLTIAINLSPVQFQHGDLPTLVHQVLMETGLAPGRLEFEITEGVLVGDFNRALAILRRLKNLGVRIAMDDFGTGYSSLSYLQAFPFDKIKIDKAFVTNLDHSQQSATIIRAVIALGHGLALPVMAEGVETEEQLRFLAGKSCDGIQGYYVGRPKPIADYVELVGRASVGKKRKPRIAIVG